MSFAICLYDYFHKTHKTINVLPKKLAVEYVEAFIFSYILTLQGSELTPKKYEDLFEEPYLKRSYDKERFYIKKSENFHKITIFEKVKLYGYLYNSFAFVKHINVYLFSDNNIINDNVFKTYEYYDSVVKLNEEYSKEMNDDKRIRQTHKLYADVIEELKIKLKNKKIY